jgi:hypothetical protein
MGRLCVLVCALFVCAGCSGDGQRGQWDEFWKDVRGHNMQMRSGPRSVWPDSDRPPP